MVTVSISETYDLSTKVNKMTLIGVHTPTKELIQKTYPGLCMNFKYFRIKSVDVALATAQTLPLGVDQIGLDQTKIHPQDMMNPILYKATSNDSWSTLEARLMGYLQQFNADNGQAELNGTLAFTDKDNVTGIADEHNVYYALLSNRDGWKMAGVREGVRMKGLVPLVFDKWYTHGENSNNGTTEDTGYDIVQLQSGSFQRSALKAYGLRGRPHPMPKMNTTYLTGVDPPSNGNTQGTTYQLSGMGNGLPSNAQIQMPDIPPVMLGAILLPPATADNGIIYYRMVTRCWIEFTDARPIQEITTFANMNAYYSPLVYHSDYDEQSKIMDATTDMVDVKNAEIEKIMEGR